MQNKSNQFNKAITIRTLTQLKQRLYTQAARSIQQHPDKADIIRKRVDADASHIAFAINMASIKL